MNLKEIKLKMEEIVMQQQSILDLAEESDRGRHDCYPVISIEQPGFACQSLAFGPLEGYIVYFFGSLSMSRRRFAGMAGAGRVED